MAKRAQKARRSFPKLHDIIGGNEEKVLRELVASRGLTAESYPPDAVEFLIKLLQVATTEAVGYDEHSNKKGVYRIILACSIPAMDFSEFLKLFVSTMKKFEKNTIKDVKIPGNLWRHIKKGGYSETDAKTIRNLTRSQFLSLTIRIVSEKDFELAEQYRYPIVSYILEQGTLRGLDRLFSYVLISVLKNYFQPLSPSIPSSAPDREGRATPPRDSAQGYDDEVADDI